MTLAPAPPEAHESGAYGGGTPRGARLAAPLLRAFDRRRLTQLERAGALTPGRLLDIGAGRGRFVAQARAAGWYAHGIEPSQRGIEGARAIGIELVAGGIDDAQVPAGSLDAASLWHVLEHVEDPGAALERIASWLRPGGMLLVGVPNLAGVQARVGGARWYHLDVPRHRTHFTLTGLEALLRAQRPGAGRRRATCSPSTTRSGCGCRSSAASRACRRGSTTRSSTTRRCAAATRSSPRSRCRSCRSRWRWRRCSGWRGGAGPCRWWRAKL